MNLHMILDFSIDRLPIPWLCLDFRVPVLSGQNKISRFFQTCQIRNILKAMKPPTPRYAKYFHPTNKFPKMYEVNVHILTCSKV